MHCISTLTAIKFSFKSSLTPLFESNKFLTFSTFFSFFSSTSSDSNEPRSVVQFLFGILLHLTFFVAAGGGGLDVTFNCFTAKNAIKFHFGQTFGLGNCCTIISCYAPLTLPLLNQPKTAGIFTLSTLMPDNFTRQGRAAQWWERVKVKACSSFYLNHFPPKLASLLFYST